MSNVHELSGAKSSGGENDHPVGPLQDLGHVAYPPLNLIPAWHFVSTRNEKSWKN